MTTPALTLPPGPHPGEMLGSRRLGPITVSHFAYGVAHRQRWHVHESATLFIVLSGSVEEQFDASAVRRSPGVAVFIPEGLTHRTLRTQRDTRVLDLRFERGWFDPLRDSLRLHRLAWRIAPSDIGDLERRLAGGDRAGEADATALILNLLARLGHPDARDEPAWLADAERHIREGLPEAPTLDELAEVCAVDRSTVARGFRRHRAVSVEQFIRLERIRLAQRLIEGSGMSLAAIAARCGFADQPHMTRTFGRVMGVTPGRYRRER